jgi:hypothetical protein
MLPPQLQEPKKKSLALAPANVKPETVSGTLPVFVTVTFCAGLSPFTGSDPKLSVAGDTCAPATSGVIVTDGVSAPRTAVAKRRRGRAVRGTATTATAAGRAPVTAATTAECATCRLTVSQ